MSKSALSFAAGAALLLMVLPNTAAAGEFTATCSSGPTCTAFIQGTGDATIEDDSGSPAGRVTCTGLTGTTSQTSGSATGSARLLFTGCADLLFHSKCQNTPTAGQITTNALTTHLVTLEHGSTLPVGILFTAINMTISCLGTKTITGNVIAEIENPNCGVARTHHTFTFETGIGPGIQKWRQITTTGVIYDLTAGPHTEDFTTTSWIATAHINYQEGNPLTLNC